MFALHDIKPFHHIWEKLGKKRRSIVGLNSSTIVALVAETLRFFRELLLPTSRFSWSHLWRETRQKYMGRKA